ncbi:carbohydrate esterase [Diplogelasinospora grovesii]|uniref:Carbohydrate esterase n=1 Tax=Diplogelasinospora grovesii TaxID=303347 RepID=A0AAN6RZF6_9PEZI|nr:carbohydrate esterase [Diplogelasinospora grovesii]
MVFSLMNSLMLALASPLAHQGVAVHHFDLGARVLSPIGNGVPLRIMPLGASITWGMLSTDGNGYRNDLRTQLTAAGNLVNMVGNVHHGTMKDNDNEGWPGYRIDQVHAKATGSVPKWKPNVILLNAGTNDAGQNRNISAAGDRMEQLLTDLYSMSPRACIVLSTLLVNKKALTEANVLLINSQFRAVADKLRRAGRRLILVDMHGDDGPQILDMADDTHPNDEGYRKMANIWYAGLVQASNAGCLQRAETVPDVPDNGGS